MGKSNQGIWVKCMICGVISRGVLHRDGRVLLDPNSRPNDYSPTKAGWCREHTPKQPMTMQDIEARAYAEGYADALAGVES